MIFEFHLLEIKVNFANYEWNQDWSTNSKNGSAEEY